MEDIEHSSLLKFIVTDKKIPTMSEPEFKLHIPYAGSNITSIVLGEQRLREPSPESNFTTLAGEHKEEVVTGIVEDSSKIDAKQYTQSKHHEQKKATDVKDEKGDSVTVASKEDFVLTPVMTVTKEEAAFTKGDLKLQKVSVKEDISDPNITTTVEQEIISIINNGEPKIRTEVLSVQQIRAETQTDEKEQIDSRKTKTRIPTMRFRQAVDRLKQERKSFEDKKGAEAQQPTPRRSSIPRLKDSRTTAPAIKDSVPQKPEITSPLPRLSDEFDKLYDEIAQDTDSLDNLSISSRIDDPVKVDNTFEEIIHAYEENKIQPINIEKVRQSKIPLLKRKSEHEIEVPKQTKPVIRQSVSVDLSKIKTSGNITENHSKIHSVTLNKSPIRTGLISKRISEIKSVQESSTGYVEKFVTVNVATIKESENNKESDIMKEKVLNKTSKDNSNKAIVNEATSDEKIKEQNMFIQKEKNGINSATSTKTSTEQVYNESLKNSNTIKSIEKHVNTEVLSDNKNEEDIPTLTGKVNRIIKRMDSKETEIKQSKRDFGDETPKKKSVLSKIALFEHHKPSDVAPEVMNHCYAQPSNIKSVGSIETKQDLSSHTPKIVEVLNVLPARHIEENNVNDTDNDINKTKASDNNNNIPVTKIEPKDNEHTTYTEIIDTQPKIASQSVEPIENTEISTNKNINPVINIHPDQNLINLNTATQFISEGNSHKFDIKIVDVQTKVPEQSGKAHVSVFPLENKLNNFENRNLNLENVENVKPAQVDSKIVSPASTYNNNEYINNIQNPSFNTNGNRYDTQEIDSSKPFVERDTEWTIQQNVFDDKHINTTYYEDLNANEPTITNNKPEIISDIVKQEVKFERKKVEDQINVEENTVFHKKPRKDESQLRIHSYRNNELDYKLKSTSLAELDLGDGVKGRVKNIIVRMKSLDRLDTGKKEIIDIKERPRKRSVSEKIALFERKLTPIKLVKDEPPKIAPKEVPVKCSLSEDEYAKKIEELSLAKTKYGLLDPEKMKYLELRDGGKMPALGIGTALLDPKLARYVVQAAIDLGYRTIDTAYIYGNEKEVGEAINEKIKDGTVLRSELFIISKLWSTFHRQDLVERACRASLDAMGLSYFDLYLIHNPMSFKEGGDPIPKIASVVQFSQHDYMDAWYGIERLVREGLVRRGGVSNFNSQQIDRVVEKGKIKPVINQVECHPYLSQQRLDEFCLARHVKLCCFGVLGSKGTPQEYKSALPPAIDDPLVRVMAAGLNVSPAALLISYQLALERGVIVKGSSAAHLWDNLQALTFTPSLADISALHALNRNKRTFTFKGMGDTHRNYPFNIPY